MACRSFEADGARGEAGASGRDAGAGGSGATGVGTPVSGGNASGGKPMSAAGESSVSHSGGLADDGQGGDGSLSGGQPSAAGETSRGGAEDTNGGDTSWAGHGGANSDPLSTPLTPDEWAGLVLWLDPSTETCTVDEEQRVSACNDLSGLNNHGVQADVSKQPKLGSALLNGHDTLAFEPPAPYGVARPAAVLGVADSDSFHFGTGDFTISLVARWHNPPVWAQDGNVWVYSGYGTLLSKTETAYPYRGFALFANYPGPAGSYHTHPRFAAHLDLLGTLVMSYQTNLNDDAFRVFTVSRSGTDFALRVNGQPDSHTQIPETQDATTMGGDLIIGGLEGAPFRGDLAELIIIKGPAVTDEIARLEQYLLEKFALGSAPASADQVGP